MSFIVVLLVTSIILGFLLLKRWKTNKFKCLESIPGPTPNPIFGNALMFPKIEDFLPECNDCLKKYGKTFLLWIGPTLPNVLTTDHKVIETLMCSSKNLNKSWQYGFFINWLGYGLLTSKTTRWRKHRKILTPAFHFQALVKFVNILERPTEILVEKLEKSVEVPYFDIFKYINLYSLDVMCETSMGTRVEAQENSESKYVNAVKEMGRIVMRRTFSVIKQSDFFYKFTSDYRKEKEALGILHGYTKSVIEKRRREMETKQENIRTNDDFLEKPTFLDILLLSKIDGQPLTDDVIREEVDTFMFEGHDTTSAGISFTLYCIANHPEIQKRALEEQVQLFGHKKNPCVRFNDLQNMKYLELIIKESLRLFPPVPLFGRKLVEDMTVDGQLYPRGLNCYVFAYGLHRNPNIYPNPDEFIPSRFQDKGSENPFAYIPFSAGQRNCIGQKFAMLIMKYVISTLLRNYELCPAPSEEKPFLVAEMILRSENGIKIKIKKRNY